MDKILEKNYQSYTQKRICKKKEKFPKNGEWEEQRKKVDKISIYIYIYTHTDMSIYRIHHKRTGLTQVRVSARFW